MEPKHPLADCANCSWAKKGNYAGESGPEDANILVIGESPGRVEVDTGEPFSGPSGKLLDRVLEHHELSRDQVRFTNVVACSPPHRVVGKAAKPPKEVINACSGRLQGELKRDNLKAVLLLGGTASSAVLQTAQAITSLRQGPPRLLEALSIHAVPTVHPAFCLRSGDNFPSLVKDIGKLAKVLKDGDIYSSWEPPEYTVLDNAHDAITVLEHLAQGEGPLAVDIECGIEKDTSFTHPKELLCVGISYATNKAVVIGEEALKSQRVWKAIRRLFHARPILCHNGKYDLQVLLRVGVIDIPVLTYDTMLASYVLDERPGHHGLEGLSSELLGAPSWKAEIKQYTGTNGSYALIPRDVLYRYNAYDVSQTYRLWTEELAPKLDKTGLRRVHDDLVAISNELIYVEFDGIGVDGDYLDVLTKQYVASLAELEEKLKPWVANPRSVPQVSQALTKLKLFAPDTQADTLKAFAEIATGEALEFLTLLLEQRKQQKLYGTYIKGTRTRLIDGRVYPTYLMHGTVFGRLAARNPNIHNIPRGEIIKRLFVPSREGHIFVQCDYSQAELRVMACEARDTYLRGVFMDPERDIHNEVSDTLYGVGNWTKEHRVRTKAFVFGSAYGREPFSIATEFGLSPNEAEELYRGFMNMIPDVVRWRQEVQDKVFKGGQALETHFGRKRRFWLITRENKRDVAKEALAFIPQSTAADLCLHSLARLRREFGWSDDGPKIRNTVHDSILVECRIEEREEVGQLMKHIMEDTARDIYSDYVPFIAEPEFGPTYGDLSE